MSLYNTDIQGNVNVSRNMNIGGNADIKGTLQIGHNLKVKGWVDARNIKGACKGLYSSKEALEEAYPSPMPGWFALVGDTLPADVYRVDGGRWVATGEKGGEFSLYLDDIETDLNALEEHVKDLQELTQGGVLLPEGVGFYVASDVLYLKLTFLMPDGSRREYSYPVPFTWDGSGDVVPGGGGSAERRIVFRGAWDAEADYYSGDTITEYNSFGQPVYERSVVEYFGLQWICNLTGTHEAPDWNGNAWTFYQGDARLRLEFASNEDTVMIDNPELELRVICFMGYEDLTDSGRIRWDWERESWNNGMQDTASDTIWNAAHKNAANFLKLGRDDLNFSFGQPPEKLVFTLTATLLDAKGEAVALSGGSVKTSMNFEI